MTRTAGRNLPLSIFATLCCAAVVVTLFVLAEPMWVVAGDWLTSMIPGTRHLLEHGFSF